MPPTRQGLNWKPKSKPQRGPEWKPRKCPACKLTFVPLDKNPANAKRKRFCTPKCKTLFHRHGGMDMDRLHEVLTRRLKAELMKDDSFLQTIADKLRVVKMEPPTGGPSRVAPSDPQSNMPG